MTTSEALRTLVAFSLILFLLRPIHGTVADAFRVLFRMSLGGLVLFVLPLDIIDNWAKQAAGWAHVTAVYVPVICLIGLIALSSSNFVFITGKALEPILKIVLYVIGGIFAIGNADWVAMERSASAVSSGVVSLFANVCLMIVHLLTP
jgi:hypothetical protein